MPIVFIIKQIVATIRHLQIWFATCDSIQQLQIIIIDQTHFPRKNLLIIPIVSIINKWKRNYSN